MIATAVSASRPQPPAAPNLPLRVRLTARSPCQRATALTARAHLPARVFHEVEKSNTFTSPKLSMQDT